MTKTIGIVGPEANKFTPETEEKARKLIRLYLKLNSRVVSGGCHLGGIDIWAKEEAQKLNKPFEEHLPVTHDWNEYKRRNKLIAKDSDMVICITLKDLPPNFPKKTGRFCYHCNTDEHVKSGGCWTVKYAKSIGKEGRVLVIE
jgi:hypothetical protein